MFAYSICGIGTSRSWQPEGRRLARSNPRLVARHTYSSRLPAQTLTALTIGTVGVTSRTGSGVNRGDGGEEPEKKIPPQVGDVNTVVGNYLSVSFRSINLGAIGLTCYHDPSTQC